MTLWRVTQRKVKGLLIYEQKFSSLHNEVIQMAYVETEFYSGHNKQVDVLMNARAHDCLLLRNGTTSVCCHATNLLITVCYCSQFSTDLLSSRC